MCPAYVNTFSTNMQSSARDPRAASQTDAGPNEFHSHTLGDDARTDLQLGGIGGFSQSRVDCYGR